MAMSERFQIGTRSHLLTLNIHRGHFATSHSHINYYIDVTPQKSDLGHAKAIAKALAENYTNSVLIDTILCLDGMEVAGTCLADVLTNDGLLGVNSNNPISIITPEYTSGGQLFFRDNILPMIEGKNVLLLAISVVTGRTAETAVEAVNYFSGNVAGIASIFATYTEGAGIPVASVFNPNDLPDYASYSTIDCPMCRRGEHIDALVNSYGCSKF